MKILLSSNRSKILYPILFSICFLVNLYYGLATHQELRDKDELWYYEFGRLYVEWLGRGDFSAPPPRAEVSGNPPLSIVLLGLLRFFFGIFGLDSYPFVTRMLTSIAIGFASLGVFGIGTRLKNHFAGLIAWLLFVPSFILVPYEFWISKELNGFKVSLDWSYGFTRVVDTTCMVFSILSIYYLIDKNRRIILSGIFHGLASITKYPAILFTPIFLILHSLSSRDTLIKTLKDFSKLLITGFFIFLIGNPIVWSINRATQHVASLQGYSEFQTLFSEALWKMITRDFDYYLFRFLMHLVTYPVGLFIEFYLVQIFVIILLWYIIDGRIFDETQLFTLKWSSAVFLTLLMINKSIVIGGWIINYYAIHLFPALSLFCSFTFAEELEKGIQRLLYQLRTRHKSIASRDLSLHVLSNRQPIACALKIPDNNSST